MFVGKNCPPKNHQCRILSMANTSRMKTTEIPNKSLQIGRANSERDLLQFAYLPDWPKRPQGLTEPGSKKSKLHLGPCVQRPHIVKQEAAVKT